MQRNLPPLRSAFADRSWQAGLRLLIGVLLVFGAVTSGRGQDVQLQFNSKVNVPNSNSVLSCSAFTVDMSYGVVSPTTAATNARIVLPLRGLTYNSIVTTPDVTTAIVRGTSPNDTLIVVMKSPLAAGSAGTLSANLQFPCGATCSGTTSSVQPFFEASNVPSQAGTSPVSLTSVSVDPVYQVNLVTSSAYNATTRRATYTVRVTPTNTPVNYLPLSTSTLSLTLPASINIVSIASTGSRTNYPTTITGGNYTPVSTTSTANGNKIITWTNLPVLYRGGNLDAPSVVVEFPAATYPIGSSTTLTSGFSGTVGTPGCSTTAVAATKPFALTIVESKPGATGCTGQVLIAGQNNPWNAIFVGKADQTRITVPLVNNGNVVLDNMTYTIDVPTNELNVTQVGITGSTGTSGLVSYQTNLTPTYRTLGVTTLATGATRSFTLSSGEYVTRVQVTNTTLAVGANMSVYLVASQLSPLRNGSAVNPAPLASFMTPTANQNSCFGGYTCATTSVSVTAQYSGTVVLNQTCTGSKVIVQPTAGLTTFAKTIPTTATSYVPGQVYTYRIQFTPATVGDTLRNFVINDVLPSSLEYVGNLKYSNTTTASTTFTSGTSLPVFTRNGQELRWSWAALPSPRNKIISTASHYLFFDVRIKAGTTGTITNCASTSLTGANAYSIANACNSGVAVGSLSKIDAIKWVRGDLDRNYTRYPKIAHTTEGGKSDYRFVLINSGNIAFKNIVLIDIFPWVGDQIVAADYARDSEWRPRLLQALKFYDKAAADSSKTSVGTIATPANVTVSYSTQTNPCRTEFNPAYSPSGCVPNSWSVTPPADLSTVQAVKINIAGPFAAGDTLVFGVDMRSPPNVPLGQIAWNSLAYQATRNDNSTVLPIAEPNKVGIDVKRFPSIGNYVWNDVNGNGQQDEPASEGVNGVSVQLWSPGGDDVAGTDDDFLVGTRVTANNTDGNPGYYKFDSLFAETYYLRFIAPAGRAFTRQSATGVANTLNSDAGGQSGWTGLIDLGPDEQDLSWDAGLCVIPNAGPDQILCAPTTSVDLPDATGSQSWTYVGTNPPGASINATTGLVTGLTTGLYRFVLTSGGGCVDTVVVERNIPAVITLSNAAPCTGESVTLTAAASGTAATYLWTGPGSYSASGQTVVVPAVTTTRSGSYTLKVTDSGCVSTTTATVSVNAPPQLTTQVGSCSATTNRYTVSGNLTVTNPNGSTVTITDTDGVRSVSIAVAATQATTAYSLTGLISNGVSHTITATYSPTYCTPTRLTYVAPVSCSCVVSATVVAGTCQPNGTFTKTNDDYFRPIVSASNTVPGNSGRYLVVLNANADGTGGTVLNSGGTTYGQSVTVGAASQFPADNETMYRLTIRDQDSAACYTTRLTPSVPPCSSCLPRPCVPSRLTKARRR